MMKLSTRLSNRLFCLIFGFCLFGLSHGLTPAHSSVILKKNLKEIVHECDLAFYGDVTEKTSAWDKEHSQIWSTVKFHVRKILKGKGAVNGTLTLKFLGGEVPSGVRMITDGIPSFKKGDRVILFRERGMELYCPIVGWFQGIFRVKEDKDTKRVYIANAQNRPIRTFSRQYESTLAITTRDAMSLEDFFQTVRKIRTELREVQ